ncbi:MAG TPA: redoxin domain-containing protein [Ignavibacteria bacterium]|nr:redoxin domain-containing protein [Ignavibacteria bacterium]
MRLGLVIFSLTLILGTISYLFWQNELKYTLPTPVPEGYHEVKPGEFISLSQVKNVSYNLEELSKEDKPVFVHFFNPDCPCSKFNIPEFRTLAKQYKDKIKFVAVALTDENYTVEDIQDDLNLNIPVFFDEQLAEMCGVYSTPQAVIIDKNHKLYYRGNYNRSRYCTDKNTNFALMAIDSVLNNTPNPVFSEAALKSYGCEIPTSDN